MKLSLQAKCGKVSGSSPETLPNLCSGDTLRYELDEQSVEYWEWNISPFWAVPYIINTGANGFTIEAPLVNDSGEDIDISGTLIGHEYEFEGIVLKKFKFKLNDVENCGTVSENSPKVVAEQNQIRIYPMPVTESVLLEWTFDFRNQATITIYNSNGEWMQDILVTSGSQHQQYMDTKALTPGIYFVSMGNSEFQYVTRLVKL